MTSDDLAHATDWALFLDFDGTLADIAERPDAVVIDPGLPGTLVRLGEVAHGALALVSGRSIDVLDGFLAPERLDAAGLHGLEHRLKGVTVPCRLEDHPALRRVVESLKDSTQDWEGVLVEDKGCTVALHWRLAPLHAAMCLGLAREAGVELGPRYRVQLGKAVAEILPAVAGKGDVIRRFLQSEPYRGRVPIFVGDDLTDENGFVAVNEMGGLSVRVGPGETVASRRVASPAELRATLERWATAGRIDVAALPRA